MQQSSGGNNDKFATFDKKTNPSGEDEGIEVNDLEQPPPAAGVPLKSLSPPPPPATSEPKHDDLTQQQQQHEELTEKRIDNGDDNNDYKNHVDEEEIKPLKGTTNEDNRGPNKKSKNEPGSSVMKRLLSQSGENADEMVDDNDADDEEDSHIPENSYSLIYTSPFASTAYWAALSIAIMQLGLLLLALLDILDVGGTAGKGSKSSEYNNPYGIPPGIPVSLRIAQVLGIMLIAMTVTVNGDLRVGILWLSEGYDAQYQKTYNIHAGFVGWLLAGLLQVCVGTAFILLALLLLLQSTDIIGMVLNFAATEFLSLIDELFFSLAQKGFLGQSLKNACADIANAEHQPKKYSLQHGHYKKYRRPCFFFSILVALFVPAGLAWSGQLNGRYVCHTLAVRMRQLDVTAPPKTVAPADSNALVENDAEDDNDSPFEIKDLFRQFGISGFGNRRVVYESDDGEYVLTWCKNTARWTILDSTFQDCNGRDDFDAVSMISSTYDVVDLGQDPWFLAHNQCDVLLPTLDVLLFCVDALCFDDPICEDNILDSLDIRSN